jgi:predicted membrane-bound dolichyl-phosphate-mannose-protein mannosyltransferase
VTTAGLRPELFAEAGAKFLRRRFLIAILAFLVLAGFGLRVWSLSAESLSEDELNKLSAVEDYRAHGLTAANGEHPFLMKAMLLISLVATEKWNQTSLVQSHPAELRVTMETALRLPAALFGALALLLIYLLAKELFGFEVALIAAALWAFDPSAIAFNRIAKEDTFVVFFFMLANVFWLRGQRAAEGERDAWPEKYYWATAAAFGAMLASKYLPYLITVSVSYNYIFQGIAATRWRIGKRRFLIFFAIMGAVFLLCNPTILLPATWREMLAFASYQKLGHDSYEFMGTLYSHKLTDWLRGIPWYFYFVFMAVKLPVLTVAAFLVGLPQLLRRRTGDGRYFLFFWMFFWFLFFGITGGKFTRYFTTLLPAVLMTAAIGLQFVSRHVMSVFGDGIKLYARAALASLVIISSAWAAVSAAPYYRLYTNALGGGRARAGDYFPQDEFYDGYMREVMFEVGRRARQGARVASETPGLAAYYAREANRADLVCVSLSDPAALKELGAGDFIIVARGRRYHSNEALLASLSGSTTPAFRVSLGGVPAVEAYMLDENSVKILTTFY